MPETAFLDFHVIVNKVAKERDSGFVTVVAEAPVSRWGYEFVRFGGGDSIESVSRVPGTESARARRLEHEMERSRARARARLRETGIPARSERAIAAPVH